VEEPTGVYMEKACPEHGAFRAMVEKDARLYRALANRDPQPRRPLSLVIPVTHRCNLRCAMCFLPDDGVPDPPRQAVLRLIDSFDGGIVFSGGEPTLHPDLPEFVDRAARQGKRTCIATNGLSLSDEKVVARLEDAGLDDCLFSFNGLKESVFRQIEGRALLRKKREALENLKGTRIKALLSTTVVDGVNNRDLASLAEFYMKERSLFVAWRIRTQAAIGRHTSADVLWLSDLLNGASEALNVDREDLLSSLDPAETHSGATHLYFDVVSAAEEGRPVLGFRTGMERSTRMDDLGGHRGLFGRHRTNLLASMSATGKVKTVLYHLLRPSQLTWYSVSLFAWPDVYNVDLDEVEQTGIYHVGPGGRIMPFVTALLLNQAKPDWSWES